MCFDFSSGDPTVQIRAPWAAEKPFPNYMHACKHLHNPNALTGAVIGLPSPHSKPPILVEGIV